MNKIWVICLLVCFFTNLHGHTPSDDSKQRDEVEGKVISAYVKEIKNKYGLYPCSSGGGVNNGIWLVSIGFNIYHPLTQDEARKLAVNGAEELLQAINSSEELRPFLRDYPFSIYNIDLAIFGFNKDGSRTFDPYFEVASVGKGKVLYWSVDPENDSHYKTTLEETYEDALAIVRQENNSLKKP